MKCPFLDENGKDCNEKCIYFKTCTRSPYKQQKERLEDGRSKVDKDNN